MIVEEALRRVARIYQTKVYRILDDKNIPGKTQIGPVKDIFVLEVEGLLCIDTEVSSPGHDIAWTRMSRGVTQQARQSLEFTPEMGGFSLPMVEPQWPTPNLETWICESGGRLRFILNSRRHRATDCTLGGLIPPGRASGDLLASSHNQCSGKTHRYRVRVPLANDVGTYLDFADVTRTSQH